MTAMNPKALRTAFGSFMTGVTVVTTRSTGDCDARTLSGEPLGFTANSFSSVSLDPPLLSVCPAKSLSSFDEFNGCEYFQVSVLSDHQQAVSNTFASPVEDRFANIDWQWDDNGCPQISGAIASFSCRRIQSVDAGDHVIMLGEVTAFEHHEGLGLGYSGGGYFSLDMERRANELQSSSRSGTGTLIVGALVESEQGLLLSADENGKLRLPEVEVDEDELALEAIQAFSDSICQQPVSLGSVYSVFDQKEGGRSYLYYRGSVAPGGASDIDNSGNNNRIDDTPPIQLCGDQYQYQYYDPDAIDLTRFASPPIEVMVGRYVRERRTGNHNLYVGDDRQGKTHRISERS